uniref:serine--tRNA ligase n=3 Tax=Hirondellea gigas TaxID=1518452 RepID=A0A6A7GCK3_9CRUS
MPLDIQAFREDQGGDLKKLKSSQRHRFQEEKLIDEICDLDSEWRQATGGLDIMRREAGKLNKDIGKLRKAGENADELQEESKRKKLQLKEAEHKLERLTIERNTRLRTIGNFVHCTVPISNNEEDNEIIREWGNTERIEDPNLEIPYELQHHHELLYRIGGYEPERGVVVAGHRGYFLTGPGVLLNMALQNFGMQFLLNPERNYQAVQPPYFMSKEVMAETAQLSQFDEELYHVTGEGTDTKYLIATSEQPLSALHRKEWIHPDRLPMKYAGISTCFRKEAGAHGKDAWGIFRVHQFEKIEQFVLCKPEDSWQLHEDMIETAEGFYKALKLPHRVVNIVSGELNNAAAKKYDLEGWFPTLQRYRELVSCSNCTDYQSRAMETRLGNKKMGDREKKYVHMLNSTLCATTRTICCILENYQTPEGVVVPEILQPFCGGIKLFPFVREMPTNKSQVKMTKAQKKQNKAKAAAAKKTENAV